MLLTQLRAYVINHFQIYNTTTCHTVLDKMHARQLKMVTAIKLSCVCFGLKKKKFELEQGLDELHLNVTKKYIKEIHGKRTG